VSKKLAETEIARKPVHLGKAINFYVDQVRLPNGKTATREYVDHPGAAAVVALAGDGTVVLVRQCRYPVGKITYELPAGKLDGTEPPLVCARRELLEETGFTAGRLRRLLTFWPAPAFSNETLYIYVADRLRAGVAALDEDEFVEVVQVPFQKAMDWISSGRIKDAKTIIGLQACALKKRAARARTK
jgi:ADP-ribose pyrophosphatase